MESRATEKPSSEGWATSGGGGAGEATGGVAAKETDSEERGFNAGGGAAGRTSTAGLGTAMGREVSGDELTFCTKTGGSCV